MDVCGFAFIVEKDDDGYYAFYPELQGCYTQGDTYGEVMENIRDAVRLHIEDRLEDGGGIPCSGPVVPVSPDISSDRLTSASPPSQSPLSE